MGKREDTRAFIIQKTAPIFNRHGYVGTSMREITEATGLTKGSVYGNFRDKEDLARHAFAQSIRWRKQALLAEFRRSGDSPLRRLQAYPTFFLKQYSAIMQYGGCPLLNTSADADDSNPELHAAAQAVIENWRGAVEKLFREAMRHGELRGGLHIKSMASQFISMVEGGLWMSRATGKQSDLKYAMQNVREWLQAFEA